TLAIPFFRQTLASVRRKKPVFKIAAGPRASDTRLSLRGSVAPGVDFPGNDRLRSPGAAPSTAGPCDGGQFHCPRLGDAPSQPVFFASTSPPRWPRPPGPTAACPAPVSCGPTCPSLHTVRNRLHSCHGNALGHCPTARHLSPTPRRDGSDVLVEIPRSLPPVV